MNENPGYDLFGFTRTVVKERYALIDPAGHVPSTLPGWRDAVCVFLISPAMGSQFNQLHIELTGAGEGETADDQFFCYVRSGEVEVELAGEAHSLTSGGYVYVPPGTSYRITNKAASSALVLFQKRWEPAAGGANPRPLVGKAQEVASTPFLGDEAAQLQLLLPDEPGMDMAVNIFTFQPGTTLPFVETHIMEHGLLMLAGQGIYRLGEDWHPVKAGDVIWMAPYCPQWFVAMGKTPAAYLYYKNINRMPEI